LSSIIPNVGTNIRGFPTQALNLSSRWCSQVVLKDALQRSTWRALVPIDWLVKLTTERAFADPETAARKLVEIAAGIEPVQGASRENQRSVS
jgi:hypothetical protein